jgi:hypothetical protein
VAASSCDSPHKDQPALVVGKEQGAMLMAGIGFKPAEDHALFKDKWFVGFVRR